MTLLKAKSCKIIFLMTFSTAIFLNHFNDPVAFALDIKEMATKMPEIDAGSEKVELNSCFFFESLGKEFNNQIKKNPWYFIKVLKFLKKICNDSKW